MPAATTKWSLDSEYIQACNCDYGCPCTFNALPTHGNCEAFVAWRVKKGSFGPTKLDGTTYAWALWWPGAIHHGNGVSRLYVDTAATPEQAKAVEEIVSGRHGGGVYEIFAKTFVKVLPSKRAKIEFHYGGYDSWFKVEGVGEARSSHIKNPVTGAPLEGEIVLPKGLNFKRAMVTNVDWWMRDEDPQLLAHHEHRGGFAATPKRANEGVLE